MPSLLGRVGLPSRVSRMSPVSSGPAGFRRAAPGWGQRAPKFCVHQGPPEPRWMPTPSSLNEQLRMFAR